MTIKEQILADIKEAMKAKDDFVRDTLRTLSAALKQIEVDKRIQMSDDVALPILQKEVKKRIDAAELYIKGGREDLADKERAESRLIEKYLPKQLSDDELEALVKEIIVSAGENLGAVIKAAKEAIGANADAKRISEAAKKLLG